ncbi:hypothetical protein [Alkaliphilus sp. B6464]|uniref:hypothetical protein n=1 Tax=Alkaliphilus sp. B6464 TaxID=2731219 RepID=UPI001BAB7FBD|nr:hypothetical protein [Alkaliphilus sp. B6464]QUH22183.1 hypothetical protein HYG84_19950 [Alkaliphilus sp. B6464]
MDKDCCKNCEALDYYDGYFCAWGKDVGLSDDKIIIDDIEKDKCEMFTKRKNKFWTYMGAEF